ncbi:hypothetical protein IPH92_04090 [Candidatus Kaiserbacteria bacterium]|nr:MAG: hypothetical protein IPH92_04090 [Candidatus Kaiserbacteria bacterium]
MKGIIRIGGALAVGIVIILTALNVPDQTNAEMSGSVVVATAPERNYIESVDSDGDGIKDWEESLGNRFIEIAKSKSSSTVSGTQAPYTPPTTLTGKFSEAFFQDYLDGKIKGEDFSNPEAFIGNAVTAIEKNSQSKRHSRLELTIIPSSFESVYTYGNELSLLLKKHSIKNENEAVILKRALETNNPSVLAELVPIQAVYTGMIVDALSLPVPETLVDEHIAFLNACEALATDIEAMQVAFSDPLYALARVKEYQNDAKNLAKSFGNFAKAFTAEGVTYANTEPAAFFYLFDVDHNAL